MKIPEDEKKSADRGDDGLTCVKVFATVFLRRTGYTRNKNSRKFFAQQQYNTVQHFKI